MNLKIGSFTFTLLFVQVRAISKRVDQITLASISETHRFAFNKRELTYVINWLDIKIVRIRQVETHTQEIYLIKTNVHQLFEVNYLISFFSHLTPAHSTAYLQG